MDKGVRVEQIYEATRRLHDAGIEVAFFLQFGYPGETREDIEKTLQMVRDCRPTTSALPCPYPMPGTRFFEAVKSELGTKQNWVDSSDLAMMYAAPTAPASTASFTPWYTRSSGRRKAMECPARAGREAGSARESPPAAGRLPRPKRADVASGARPAGEAGKAAAPGTWPVATIHDARGSGIAHPAAQRGVTMCVVTLSDSEGSPRVLGRRW